MDGRTARLRTFFGWWSYQYGGAPRWLLLLVVLLVIAVAGAAVRSAAANARSADPGFTYSPPARVTVEAGPTLAPIPRDSTVLFLGDSYTAGTGTTDPATQSWPVLTAKSFGWKPVIRGVGGTGYTWGGGTTGAAKQQYINRLDQYIATQPAAPDAVVLEGSQNDWRAQPGVLQTAVETVIKRVKSAWPKAQIIVFGPVAPQPLGSQIVRIAQPVMAAASVEEVPSIDPLAENWLTDANSKKYNFDNAHVNVAGHQYLAQRLVADIKALEAAHSSS